VQRSIPENPALHIPDPLSITKAWTSDICDFVSCCTWVIVSSFQVDRQEQEFIVHFRQATKIEFGSVKWLGMM
jgi:hypothetical protein